MSVVDQKLWQQMISQSFPPEDWFLGAKDDEEDDEVDTEIECGEEDVVG